MSELLLENVEASYGQSQALFGVSFSIKDGEVLALLGRNGMGKSTTVKSICRLLPASGTIRFDGKDVARLKPHQVSQMGVGLVPEGRRCFPNLTVTENLLAAARSGHWDIKRIGELFPRLEERGGQSANTLSGGEQQMLAIARALMTNPRLLILDEATEGLAPIIRQEIWAAIRDLKSSTGLSLLIIDKSISELSKIADKAVVLLRGKNAWEGDSQALQNGEADSFLAL